MFVTKFKIPAAALLVVATLSAEAVEMGFPAPAGSQPPPAKTEKGTSPAAARDFLIDFLPLVGVKDKSKLNDREREILPQILKKLENGKVPTVKKAKDAAQQYKFKASGILAEEAPHVVSLLPLGTDVPDFGKRGDLVWVVQFRVFHGAITQEVWVDSDTGHVLAIVPRKR
jgi:hypothetical protein